MAVAISQTANPAGAGSGTTITYTQSIGAADLSRFVVVCVGAELSSGSPSSATFDYGSGAVAMTAGTLGSQGNVFSRIFYAPAPTGTTADIAVTFGASQGSTTHHIAVYRVIGGVFSAESAVGDTDADPISSGSITIPTNGGCIGICAMAADASARTWSGITEDIDEDAGTFQFTTGTSTTAGTPTITVSGANNEDGALSWLIFKPGYQLAIDAGSYAVTGQNVTLSLGKTVAVDAGSYSISGQNVTLTRNLPLTVDSGSYSVSGQDVALSHVRSIAVDAGSYSISGQDVTLSHGYTAAADAGSYAVAGQEVALDLAASSSRAIVSWAEISFAVGAAALSIPVDTGSFSISGQDVALAHQWMMDVETGGYLVSGQDVELSIDEVAETSLHGRPVRPSDFPFGGRRRGKIGLLDKEWEEQLAALADAEIREAAEALVEAKPADMTAALAATHELIESYIAQVDAAIRDNAERRARAEVKRIIAEAKAKADRLAYEMQDDDEAATLLLL